MGSRAAVFLDRDGVINRTVLRRGKQRAPQDFSEFSWVEGVQEVLAKLHARGYLLLVCTNQPDVARGWQRRDQVDAFHAHIRAQLPIAHIYACFHDEADACSCRKPLPGMLLEGAHAFDVDLTRSYMVGDRDGDIMAGRSAGCTTVHLRHPEAQAAEPAADHEIRTLAELLHIIR